MYLPHNKCFGRSLQDSGLAHAFHVIMKIPLLGSTSHIKAVLQHVSRDRNDFPDVEIEKSCNKMDRLMGVKQLLIIYEMASELSKKGEFVVASFCFEFCTRAARSFFVNRQNQLSLHQFSFSAKLFCCFPVADEYIRAEKFLDCVKDCGY